MSTPTTPSSLHALLVFNPDLGEEATEGRKILYFCDNRPDTLHRRSQPGQQNYVDLNYQKDICGIAEGLIAFTRDFAPETLCESVHCAQHRYAFLQVEPSYWLILVVKNPTLITKSDKKDGSSSGLLTEYLEDELEDSVLQAIIHRCYSLFSLFNSSFSSIVEKESHEALRLKLNLFMAYFLPTIRFSQLIYFTDIHGFQFLPVEKIAFLTIQYIINLLTLNFTSSNPPAIGSGAAASPQQQQQPLIGSTINLSSSSGTTTTGVIRNCALMYNSKLIYSGLNSEIMFLLYSLDQDMMYWFLVEYLTLKENLHLDIQRYYAALRELPVRKPENAWSRKPPQHIPGIFNVPESVYERNGRLAENRKAFEKALNKSEIPQDTEWVEEEENPEEHSTLSEDDGVLLDKEHLASSRSNSGAGQSSSSGASSTTPFGFMTGPFRGAHTPAPAVAGSSSAATMPGFSAGVSNAAVQNMTCLNSPLIYLNEIQPKKGGATTAQAQQQAKDPFGAGDASMEGNLPSYSVFPGSKPSSAAPASADPSAAAPSATGAPGAPAASNPPGPLRLVVYQKYKITLFLIVEEEVRGGGGSSTASQPNPNNPIDSVTSALQQLSITPSPATSALLTSLSQSHPPVAFYTQLEAFMDSNLKKLAEMLYDQTTRLNLNGGALAEEPWRFLYFNHMNLALKTSLSSTAPSGGTSSGKGSSSSSNTGSAPGSLLTMETIKLIRELHQDFNTKSFRTQEIASSTGISPVVKPPHQVHSIREEGCTEVCVKTKHHGWVVGRRATQSHREFFLLLEEKIANLAEIQEEVESLSRTYFYNIFIH